MVLTFSCKEKSAKIRYFWAENRKKMQLSTHVLLSQLFKGRSKDKSLKRLLHCIKRLTIFPSLAGLVTSRQGTGKSATFVTVYNVDMLRFTRINLTHSAIHVVFFTDKIIEQLEPGSMAYTVKKVSDFPDSRQGRFLVSDISAGDGN